MKKFNFKALLVNHGEKIALGFVATIVFGVLTGGTTWGRFGSTPDELKNSVANARTKITSPDNVWPKAKEETFAVVNFTEKARQLFVPLSIAKYDISVPPLFYPLYQKDEPKKESIYEPVEYLIVSGGLVSLSVLSEEDRRMADEQAKTEATAAEQAPETTSEDSEFSTRPTGTAVPGGPGATGPAGISRPGGAMHGMGSPPGRGPGMGGPGMGASGASGPGMGGPSGTGGRRGRPGTTGAGSAAGGAHGMGGGGLRPSPLMMPGSEEMMGNGMAGAGVGGASRGVRFIAVRGVFSLRKQVENYKRALHLPQLEAEELIEITEFVLERQSALPGDDPWKESKWETVNVETALEVLHECTDLDPLDPVPLALHDAAITMQLPMRLTGVWDKYATHPKIKSYEMDRQQIEAESKLLEKLDDKLTEAGVGDAPQRKKGLAGAQRDVRKMARSAMGSSAMGSMGAMGPGAMGAMGPGSMGAMGPGSMGSQRPGQGGQHGSGASPMGSMGAMGAMGAMMAGGKGRGTQIDRLAEYKPYLLFRYFDFEVQGGMAYRYRVRLKLKNPNFERSPDELAGADAEIAKGEERETPWSNISNAEIVPTTKNYFLKHVDHEPYHEEKVKASGRTVASLSVYDWDMKLGTVIHDLLKMTAIGGYVADPRVNTLQLDLAAGVLEKKPHAFTSQDVLLDVEADSDVSMDQHPDLKLVAEKGRGSNVRLGLLEEAILVTSAGDLKTLDPNSSKSGEPGWMNESYWSHRADEERKPFKEGSPNAAASRSSRYGSRSGTGTGADEETSQPRRNPRRGRGGAQGMSGMSSMMPGMSGMSGMMPGVGGQGSGTGGQGSAGGRRPSSR